MNSALSLALQAFGLFNLADFVAGFVHWFEDAYVDESTPLIGRTIGRANVIHHHLPRHFTRNTWWQSNRDLHLFSAALILLAWAGGFLGWQVWFFGLVCANANEVHKWSHRTRAENGRLISFLQDLRVLQTAAHHARHHTDPKHSHYCPVGNFVNPVLDRLGFWNGLEQLLALTLGLKRREDSSVHGHGPAPAWIKSIRQQSRPEFQISNLKSGALPQPAHPPHECLHHADCPHHGNCPLLRVAGHRA